MAKCMQRILFVVGVILVCSAQIGRCDDKRDPHALAAESAPAVHNESRSRPQVQSHPMSRPQPQSHPSISPIQNRRQVSQQISYRPVASAPRVHSARQQGAFPRVYAVPEPAPTENGRFFHRQHHDHWQPRYNFYDNQYQFYPYVNIASTVELSSDGISVEFEGENYYYDQGTFYQQDVQGRYVAIPPPVGIIVNPLAARARQIVVNGQVFYRYKGVFYIQVDQGYQVIAPLQSVSDDS